MNVTAILKDSLSRIRRTPRLSAAAVFCIALGMAATASVATLVSLTSFRPLPFPESDRLVRIWNAQTGDERHDALAWVDYTDLKAGMTTLEQLEAAARARLIWHLPGRAGRRVEGEAVSGGYFDILGVEPFIGRSFTAGEIASGDPVMLMSHATWGREFNYADDILGRTVRTSTQNQGNETTFTVIGVLPPDFHGTVEDDMPDLEFWIPVNSYYSPEERQARDAARNTWVTGLLKRDATLDAATAEVAAIGTALAPEFAVFMHDHEFRLQPFGENWRAGYSGANELLSGAAVLLLAVAVLNVAMLLLVRAMRRRHEMAVRAAIGAGRWRLIAPELVETVLLALIGGAIGLAAAGPLLDFFLSLSGVQIPSYLEVSPDGLTLGITFAFMLTAGVAAASLPAWATAHVDVNDALREGSGRTAGSRSASRWGRWIVTGQVALTMALLLAATLLGRSYLELENRDLGFATDNRLRMGLFINPADVAEPAGLPTFVNRVETELLASPGVLDVAMAWPTVPLVSPANGRLTWPDMPETDRALGLQVSNYIVHEGFFSGLRIPLVAGRTFDSRDENPQVRTAVIGRSLADRLGGPREAVHREVELNGGAFRIVGVVGDAKFGGPREGREFDHQMYLSYAQLPRRVISPVIQVSGDPRAHIEPLKEVIARVAPNSAVDWVDPVNQFVGWLYRDSAFRLALVVAFAVSALLLAAVGLYAVLAQQVTAATAEIGIRKTLGASDGHILGRVIRRGLTMVLAGIGAGVLISLGFSRALAGLLYGVGTMDPAAYAAAGATLIAVAFLACFLPARHAARIAPIEALRDE